jgi:hypothetical protein
MKEIVGFVKDGIEKLFQKTGQSIDATSLSKEGKLNHGLLEYWLETLQDSTTELSNIEEQGRQASDRITDREVDRQSYVGIPGRKT